MARKIQDVIKENDELILQFDSNRKELIKLSTAIDQGSQGLIVFLLGLHNFSKKLTPQQRNRLGRSINNAMSAIKGVKADIKNAVVDCGFQAMAVKYKNDGLKRDQSRRNRNAP